MAGLRGFRLGARGAQLALEPRELPASPLIGRLALGLRLARRAQPLCVELLLEVSAHLGQPPLARLALLLDRRQPLGTTRLLEPRHLTLGARALRRDLSPRVVAHLRLEAAHLLALLRHEPLDVGLEAAHRAVLDLLGLLRDPLLTLGRLRLRPQRALPAQLLGVALLLPAQLRLVLGLDRLGLLRQPLAPGWGWGWGLG